jgi:hypothetical protein
VPQILDSIVEIEDQTLQSWGGAASWEKQVGVARLILMPCQGNLHVFFLCDEIHCCGFRVFFYDAMAMR